MIQCEKVQPPLTLKMEQAKDCGKLEMDPACSLQKGTQPHPYSVCSRETYVILLTKEEEDYKVCCCLKLLDVC